MNGGRRGGKGGREYPIGKILSETHVENCIFAARASQIGKSLQKIDDLALNRLRKHERVAERPDPNLRKI